MQKPPLNTHVDVCSEASVLNFGLNLHLHSYFVYVCSWALVRMHRLRSPEPSLHENAINTKISLCVNPLHTDWHFSLV